MRTEQRMIELSKEILILIAKKNKTTDTKEKEKLEHDIQIKGIALMELKKLRGF